MHCIWKQQCNVSTSHSSLGTNHSFQLLKVFIKFSLNGISFCKISFQGREETAASRVMQTAKGIAHWQRVFLEETHAKRLIISFTTYCKPGTHYPQFRTPVHRTNPNPSHPTDRIRGCANNCVTMKLLNICRQPVNQFRVKNMSQHGIKRWIRLHLNSL